MQGTYIVYSQGIEIACRLHIIDLSMDASNFQGITPSIFTLLLRSFPLRSGRFRRRFFVLVNEFLDEPDSWNVFKGRIAVLFDVFAALL